MVVTKNGHTIHPCIKEVIFVTSSVPSSLPKPRTSRISELPSLRYGPVGAKTSLTGPLRVSGNCRYAQHAREARSASMERDRDKPSNKPVKARRVRFALPPADGSESVENRAENIGTFPPRISSRIFHVNSEKPVSQRPAAKRSTPKTSSDPSAEKFSLTRRFERFRKERLQNHWQDFGEKVEVPVSFSPGVRHRVHPTGRYIRGTLSPTSNQAPHEPPVSPGGQALLRAARDGDDQVLREQLRRALAVGISETDLNATDSSGRTILSYVASNGTIDLLELMLQVPGLDPNKPDNEGNTPLHFAAQAGQVECLNCLASRCRGVEIDARNNLGFTPLMKAALQGRNKCAKLLLFAAKT
uniref:Uncharacterized protein n=1 Tax=Dendroctonus ponderosae TaxID=77166 RepID=A0AAR5Q5Z9_DENPD